MDTLYTAKNMVEIFGLRISDSIKVIMEAIISILIYIISKRDTEYKFEQLLARTLNHMIFWQRFNILGE